MKIETLVLLQSDPSRLLGYGALAAIAVVTYFSLRTSHRKLRESNRVDAREPIERFKNREPLRNDMEELLVQLQELSRNINAQIDTRFAKLEASIRAADERIARLHHLAEDVPPPPEVFDEMVDDDDALPADAAAAPASRAVPEPQQPASAHEHVYQMADAGRSPVDIARQTGRTTGEIELILALRAKPGRAL